MPSLTRTASDIARGTDAITRAVRRPVSAADSAGGTDLASANLVSDIWRPLLHPSKTLLLTCRTPSGTHDSSNGYGAMQLWTFQPDGSGAQRVKDIPSRVSSDWTSYGHPEWDNTGANAVIWAQTASQSMILTLDGTTFANGTTLVTVSAPDLLLDPSYSPDAATVIYVQRAGPFYLLGTWTQAGTSNVGAGQNPLADPYFSPNGTQVIYSEMTGAIDGDHPYGQWTVKLLPKLGDVAISLVSDGNANVHPRWISDDEIVFQTFRYGFDTGTQMVRIQPKDLTTYTVIGPGEYPRVEML